MKPALIAFAALSILPFASLRSRAEMIHPGGWHTEADLERIRAGVASGNEPWKSARTALKDQDAGIKYHANVKPQMTDTYGIQRDGHAAYVLAIKWVASGDIKDAIAGIKIINDWTSTVESVANEPMRNGLGCNQMANAAEIFCHGFDGAAGWSPENAARCRAWFKGVVYPHLKNGAAANWGTSAMAGIMSMSVFCDDQQMFDRAVDAYKQGFVVNCSLKGGCAGVAQYIDATGENAESGRDQAHSRGGIAHLAETALVAWNQHVDLINYNDDHGVLNDGATGEHRLLIGLEYTAKYNLGNDVPYHLFFEYCNNVFKYSGGIPENNRGDFSPIYEMACALFTKAKLEAPYCRQM